MNPFRASLFSPSERLARRQAAETARVKSRANREKIWQNGVDFLASIRSEISSKVSDFRASAETVEQIGVQRGF